jgi:hypothetical protein
MRNTILLLLSSIFAAVATPASADENSADFYMAACKKSLEDKPLDSKNPREVLLQGACQGMVAAVVYLGPVLPEEFKACLPKGTPRGQLVSAVVKFVDGHPDRMKDDFVYQAAKAIHEAWPCKK